MSGRVGSVKAAPALARRAGRGLGGLPAPDDIEPHGPSAAAMSSGILIRALDLVR